MPNVNPVPPSTGPSDNSPSKKSSNVDSDKFKKEMHKRVEKVNETDPEQQKKRKRQNEADEEDDTMPAQGPTTPPNLVTPFSLTTPSKKANPTDLQKGGTISPLASSQPTKSQGAPSSPVRPPVPSSDEMEDDSGLSEETTLLGGSPATPTSQQSLSAAPPPEEEELPESTSASITEFSEPQETPYAAPSTTTPQQGTPQPLPPRSQDSVDESQDESEPQPTPPSTPPTSSKQASTAQGLPPPPMLKPEPSKEAVRPLSSPVTPKKEKEGFTADILEEASKEKKPEEQTTVFFEQFLGGGKEGDQGKKGDTPKDADEQAIEGITPFSMTPPSPEKDREDEERVAAESGIGASATPEIPQGLPDVQAAPPVHTPYANLHPQVLELFERTVGVMTVMHMSGIKETSITLDNPKFASSVFFGSEIIIKEYSSAPKEFNIQINGSPQAMSLLQGNTQDLMAAFQYGNFNFRVNRLDTGLLADKPLFKRKEPPSGDKQNQQGTT